MHVSGSETDYYSSYYEWDTPGAIMGQDNVFHDFIASYTGAGCLNGVGANMCSVWGFDQDAPFDPENFTSGYLTPNGQDTFIPQGPHLEVQVGNREAIVLSYGRWVQHEMWLHPNTCSAGMGEDSHGQSLPAGNGNGDGFYRFYIDGVLLNQVTGTTNPTGCPAFIANTVHFNMGSWLE